MTDQAKTKKKRVRRREGADGLTSREREFVHAYAQTLTETAGKGNQTQAAIMIGCPEASAKQRGCGFMKLPQVQSAITVLVEARAKRFDINAEKITQELACTAFSNMADYLSFGKDGAAVIDWSKLTREQSAAIQEVTIDEYMDKTGEQDDDGKPTFERVKRIRFRLGDKKGSLELLGKTLKLFTDGLALQNPDGSALAPPTVVVEFTDKPE